MPSHHGQAYTIKVNHLPPHCPDSQVLALFSKFGIISSVKVNHSGADSYAYVNFCAPDSAQNAKSEMNGYVLGGHILRIGGSKRESQYTLKVVNIAASVEEQELELICKKFGDVRVKINPGSDGNYAYLNFSDQQGADRAYKYLNGLDLGSGRLKVKWHSRPPERPPPVQQCQSGLAGAGMSLPGIKQVSSVTSRRYTLSSSSPSRTDPFPPVMSPDQRHSLGLSPLSPTQPLSSTVKVNIHGKGITPQNLHDIFSRNGVVGPIIIRQGAPDFAYINFSAPSEASQALSQSRFRLNGVTIFVKPSTKQPSSSTVKESKEIRDGDPLVNLLWATVHLGDASSRVSPLQVIVRAAKGNNGLQISGDSEDVSLAECHLRDLACQIKETITVETVTVHCKTIPVFADPSPIQQLTGERKVEFTIINTAGQAVRLAHFGSTVASLSQGTDPVQLSAFSGFLTTSSVRMKDTPTANVSWKFKDESRTYSAMPYSHSQALETSFQQDQTSTSSVLCLGQWTYSYNFQTMKQTNIKTGMVRKIKRIAPRSDRFLTVQCRGLPGETQPGMKALEALLLKDMIRCPIPLHQCSAKADEVLSALAHQYCIEVLSSSSQQIVIAGASGYIEKIALKLKERALEFRSSADAKFPVPSTWELPATTLELKPVHKHSSEWMDVVGKMQESMDTVSIVKIERIQNPWLWERYAFCKQRMAKKNQGNVNEKKLFHGTRGTQPDKVYASEHGFDFRYGGNGLWGHGAYFAVKPSYCARSFAYQDGFGFRQILLALVLTGESVSLGSDNSLTKPPVKPSPIGSVALVDELYDSVKGHNGGSDMYIVYDHDKAYPAYLITFQ